MPWENDTWETLLPVLAERGYLIVAVNTDTTDYIGYKREVKVIACNTCLKYELDNCEYHPKYRFFPAASVQCYKHWVQI
jgi:hypothetical protein